MSYTDVSTTAARPGYFLDVAPMISALQFQPTDFELSHGWLNHVPSRHRFKFDKKGQVTIDARCDCSGQSVSRNRVINCSTPLPDGANTIGSHCKLIASLPAISNRRTLGCACSGTSEWLGVVSAGGRSPSRCRWKPWRWSLQNNHKKNGPAWGAVSRTSPARGGPLRIEALCASFFAGRRRRLPRDY